VSDMDPTLAIRATMIAPCGMNCGTCLAFLREKNRCWGCRGTDELKPGYCVECIIATCGHLKKTKAKFCSSKCPDFPCKRLKALDRRYRTKYQMSMLENLQRIEEKGIRAFVKSERKRWTCPECGGTICVHRDHCPGCGKKTKRPLPPNRTNPSC